MLPAIFKAAAAAARAAPAAPPPQKLAKSSKSVQNMFGRGWTFAMVMAGALGVPYLLSHGGVGKYLTGGTSSEEDVGHDTVSSPGSAATADRSIAPVAANVEQLEQKLVSTPFHTLEDVLRFDITTAWVLGNWDRVSTRLSRLDLQGYRVPLVTGTGDADIAGSLTYYFDNEQRLQRITLFGTTGDARPIVNLVISRFEFMRKITEHPHEYIYQVRYNGKAVSELRIEPAKVITASNPHGRFEVALLIERPKNMD